MRSRYISHCRRPAYPIHHVSQGKERTDFPIPYYHCAGTATVWHAEESPANGIPLKQGVSCQNAWLPQIIKWFIRSLCPLKVEYGAPCHVPAKIGPSFFDIISSDVYLSVFQVSWNQVNRQALMVICFQQDGAMCQHLIRPWSKSAVSLGIKVIQKTLITPVSRHDFAKLHVGFLKGKASKNKISDCWWHDKHSYCNSSLPGDGKINEHGALCPHVTTGKVKPFSVSFVSTASQHLPRYLLVKFDFRDLQ